MKNEEKILKILEAMQADISGLKEGQRSLQDGQKSLENGQSSLQEGQRALEDRQKSLEEGQIKLELRMENEVINKINALYDGYELHTQILNHHTELLQRIEGKSGVSRYQDPRSRSNQIK
ncbi:MAG: hypothetical protein ABFD04_00065 [Syntrophomonas sp.]